MTEEQIKNLIKIWYQRSNLELNNPFSKFLFLWICFNAWIAHRSEKRRDLEMIEWLIGQNESNSDLILNYENAKNTKSFVNNLKSFAMLSPISDSRGINNPIIIKDENDRENIIRGIYKIRCNLFHGGKSDESRDSKLVTVSCRILEKWIGNLISNW